jgi:hypothetical protein
MNDELLSCKHCGEAIWPGEAGMATSADRDGDGEPVVGTERWHAVHNRCLDDWKAARP